MLQDLVQQVQQAIGDAYRLERELPGGGMSRLFLATERSLNRTVVIKVLAPELASPTSAARFRREVDILANLQHPHILPILSADTDARNGLLFYVMPYVAGESLRHRLAREGRLPIATAVQILREAADALAYAHRHGVVHRDIKPENILLADDHAVVADFGIARALVTAAGGGLTGTGLSVGTPGYMSPEQVAGEPTVDARADIYALAVVGYEMLVGRPPFSGGSAQAVLSAHLRDTPTAPHMTRPEVPRPVSDALMRALAKDPDARFPSASAFRDALGAATEPPAAPRRRRHLALAAAGAGVLVISGSAAILHSRRAAPVALDASLVAIAPFEVLAPDLALWREGLVDVLSRNLDGAGALRTVSPSVVIKRWSGRADRASADSLGRRTGAGLAVFGTLERTGTDSVRLALTVLDVDGRRPLGELERRDAVSRMDRLVDSASVGVIRLLSGSGATGAARLSAVGTKSLAALKEFLRGEQLYRRVELDSAELHYRRAVELDTTFALAYRGLGNTHGWGANGNPDPARESAPHRYRAAALNHGLGARDSMLILADSLHSALSLSPGAVGEFTLLRRLLAVTERLAREYATDPDVLYHYADVRYHFGSHFTGISDRGVLDAFARAIASDSAYAPAYLHAIPLAFHLGGEPLGRRYTEAFVAHSPGGPHGSAARLWLALTRRPRLDSAAMRQAFDSVGPAVLHQTSQLFGTAPDSTEVSLHAARAIWETARARQSADPRAARFAEGRLAAALTYRGRVAEAARLPHVAEMGLYAMLVRLGAVSMDSARAVFAASLAPGGPLFECVGGVVAVWAPSGDTASVDACARYVRSVAFPDSIAGFAHLRPVAVGVTNAYQAWVRHDSAAAEAAFASLPDSLCPRGCANPGYIDWANLLAGRGRAREALAVLDGRAGEAGSNAVPFALARARIAVQLGDRERAMADYGIVANAWGRADEPLQPVVAEARRELARLSSDTREGTRIAPVKR